MSRLWEHIGKLTVSDMAPKWFSGAILKRDVRPHTFITVKTRKENEEGKEQSNRRDG